MNTRALLLAVCLTLSLALPVPAQTNKAALVQFYQAYMTLVSASDYVTVSRDQPETWDQRFDAIAQSAGFANAADAVAAGEELAASDTEIADLRLAVANKILQQYAPYKE